MELTTKEKEILLSIARNKINSLFNETPQAEIDYQKYPLLNSKSGAFVTLTINNSLRGCIGYIESSDPLHETIKNAAKQAAIGDPRFPPLSKNEFEKIHIEISVLSEPYALKNYDEIELGKHGLILEESGRRGLLLPQVPIEHNMNKEQYLSALCNKAGFYSDLWKEKQLHLSAFTATVFSESELGD